MVETNLASYPNPNFVNAKYKIYDDKLKITVFDKRIFYIGKKRPKIEREKYVRRTASECEQRKDSMHRSHEAVFDIAQANEWKYFVTFTLADDKCDVTDYEMCATKLKNWLSNQVKRRKIMYLIVPDLGKKTKRLHFHGLIAGDIGELKYHGLDKRGHAVYNAPAWPFGFSTVIETYGDKKNLAKYMTKYITKHPRRILKKYYYAGGKGLQRSVPCYYTQHDYEGFEYDKQVQINKPDVKFNIKYKTVYYDTAGYFSADDT